MGFERQDEGSQAGDKDEAILKVWFVCKRWDEMSSPELAGLTTQKRLT
jgi:hypothetical protein